MTDKLTPGQLRDLAELCAVGNRVVTLTANGETTRFYPNKDLSYVLLEEAARREADAAVEARIDERLDATASAALARGGEHG